MYSLEPPQFEAVDIDKLLILSKNYFKGPLTAQIILNWESITFSVKRRENAFADP